MSSAVVSKNLNRTKLDYADKLAKKRFGMSYTKFCQTVLVDNIYETSKLPTISKKRHEEKASNKAKAIQCIKSFGTSPKHPEIGEMNDNELKDLCSGTFS